MQKYYLADVIGHLPKNLIELSPIQTYVLSDLIDSTRTLEEMKGKVSDLFNESGISCIELEFFDTQSHIDAFLEEVASDEANDVLLSSISAFKDSGAMINAFNQSDRRDVAELIIKEAMSSINDSDRSMDMVLLKYGLESELDCDVEAEELITENKEWLEAGVVAALDIPLLSEEELDSIHSASQQAYSFSEFSDLLGDLSEGVKLRLALDHDVNCEDCFDDDFKVNIKISNEGLNI